MATANNERDADSSDSARVIVKGAVPDRNIPDNIDPALYTDDESERESVSFSFDLDSDLADKLREEGYDVPPA